MPAVLKPIEPRRLYQQVADQIRSLIASGGFLPGTRLPPERDLAQQLGVSRPSLREALIALEIDGSVEIRMGSGVYVCAPPERVAANTVALGESPSELMQARAALEGAVVALACARATPDGIARLREALSRMQAEIIEGRSPVDHDRQFHLTLAQMSGNSVLARLVGDLFDERHSPISSQLRERFDSLQTWRAAVEEHEAIVQAIEAADPLAAQTAMRHHLKTSTDRWIGG